MVNVIAVGDQHFKTDNIKEVDLFIDKMTELIEKNRPDFVVLLGDLLHEHERIHIAPLNRAYKLIDSIRQITKTFVLVGNHDMCLGKDTPVLLYDGSVKMSQDIDIDDILVGYKGKKTKITSTVRGVSELFIVKQENGIDYVVNKYHKLTLKYKLEENPHIKFKRDDIIDIAISDYIHLPEDVKDNFYGIKYPSMEETKITVSPCGKGMYYGFTVEDIYQRFLLGDGTITHNCNNQVFLKDDHWLNAMKEWDNVVIVDKVIKYEINEMKFVFTPYVYVGRFEEALETLGENWKDATAIFAHQEFFGCKMGAFNSIDGDKWNEEYPNVISGHIHLNHRPQKNIYYPGSSLPVAFGESKSNIVADLTFSIDEDYRLNEIDLRLPKKKIIYTTSEDIEKLNIPISDDKIKISISGEYEEFKSLKKTKKYKELTDQGVKFVFKAKKLPKISSEEIKETNITNDFHEILRNIVEGEKNSYLYEAYELIVNDKIVEADDILIL